jgi:hypothetical protein
MKNLKTFENYSENIEEENWLENKTDEELLEGITLSMCLVIEILQW